MGKRKSNSKGKIEISLLRIITILLIALVFYFGTLAFFTYVEEISTGVDWFDEAFSQAFTSTFYDLLVISEETTITDAVYFVAGIWTLVLLGVAGILTLISTIAGAIKKSAHYIGFITGIILIIAGILILHTLDMYLYQGYESVYGDLFTKDTIESLVEAVKQLYSYQSGYYLMAIGSIAGGVIEIICAMFALFVKKQK